MKLLIFLYGLGSAIKNLFQDKGKDDPKG